TGRADGLVDRGRIDGVAQLLKAEFGVSSKWSDAQRDAFSMAPSNVQLAAFKTPTLRGVPNSAPYGHGGREASLAEVAAAHGVASRPGDPCLVGQVEPWVSPGKAAIVPFLQALTADPVVP